MAEKTGPAAEFTDVYRNPSDPPPYEASASTGPASYPHPQPTAYPQPQPAPYHHPQPVQYPPQPNPYPQSGATITVIPRVPGQIIITPAVGSQPTLMTCKSCGVQNVTRVEFNPSMRTHLMALLLCVFGCWPCVCVPYCMDSCNNVNHYCSNCGAYSGTYLN